MSSEKLRAGGRAARRPHRPSPPGEEVAALAEGALLAVRRPVELLVLELDAEQPAVAGVAQRREDRCPGGVAAAGDRVAPVVAAERVRLGERRGLEIAVVVQLVRREGRVLRVG